MNEWTPSDDDRRPAYAAPGPDFPPDIPPVFVWIREANHLMGCYARHFAGKQRATRDVALLDELVGRLAQVRDRLDGLTEPQARAATASRLAGCEQQLALLRQERELILAARAQGDVAERSAWLAARMNEQFMLYRVHFAGQTRQSRRPALLRHVVTSLEEIHAELGDPGFAALAERAGHDSNRALAAEQLVLLRKELGMVELEVQGSSPLERAAALGRAANADLQAYQLDFAGQDRSTRNLASLGQICDRLVEIEQQFVDLLQANRSDAVSRSLEAVQSSLDLFQGEYEQIAALQRAAGT